MTLRKREKKFQHPQIWGVAAERSGRLRRGASAAPARYCRGPAGSRRAARRRAAPGAPGRLRSRCGARRSRGAAGGGRSRSGAPSLVHFGPLPASASKRRSPPGCSPCRSDTRRNRQGTEPQRWLRAGQRP